MTLRDTIRISAALLAIAWLGACSTGEKRTPKRETSKRETSKRATPGAPLATRPQKDISKTARKHMYVRTTAYHHTEPGGRVTAMGGYLKATHSAAADWSWLPAGTRFRIVETGEDYIVEDYGSALVGRYTIDLYKSTRKQMNAWGVRYVNIEIIEMGSYKVSLAVLKPRQKWRHVRAMVVGLQKKV